VVTHPQQKEMPQIELRCSFWSIVWDLDGDIHVRFRSVSKDGVEISVVEHCTYGFGWIGAVLGIGGAGGNAEDDAYFRGSYDVALSILR